MATDPHCRETAVDRSWLAYDPLQINYWTGLPTFRWEYSRVRSPLIRAAQRPSTTLDPLPRRGARH
jgi:hypothetical protein